LSSPTSGGPKTNKGEMIQPKSLHEFMELEPKYENPDTQHCLVLFPSLPFKPINLEMFHLLVYLVGFFNGLS
jgi:hypothetical protein